MTRARTAGTWRLIAAVAAVTALTAPGVTKATTLAAATPQTAKAAPEPMTVEWIAVSPAYLHTGVVAALGFRFDCPRTCSSLWVSRNGGASWRQAASRNWTPRHRLIIAVDSRGHDVFYGTSQTLLMRSDDLGETFVPVGPAGRPTALPSYASDGGLVVASLGRRSDYVLRQGTAQDVTGSSGLRMADMVFAVSPTFPTTGAYTPALLGAAVGYNTLLLRCSADFACSRPVTLHPATSRFATADRLSLHLAADFAEHGTVFADTATDIEKSTDGGTSFQHLTVVPETQGLFTSIPMMVLAPGYREADPDRTAYAAVTQVMGPGLANPQAPSGVYVTHDGGTSWRPTTTSGPLTAGATALAIAPDGRLFAGYSAAGGGILCSTDGGTTWLASCPRIGDVPNPDSAAAVSAQTEVIHTTASAGAGFLRWPLLVALVGVLAVGVTLWRRMVRRSRSSGA
jgi:hypothetical protein